MATKKDFKIKHGLTIENGSLVFGEDAYSSSTNYVGLKTSYMTGTDDYMIISGKSNIDGNTYISARNTDSVLIRGGGNLGSNQIKVPDSNYIEVTTTEFRVSGKAGINNTSPSSQFFNTLVVGNTSGDHGITIQSSATGRGALAFSDTDSATSGRYDGYINYSHNATYMSFHVNTGNEQMRIDSSGNLLVGKTNTTFGNAGIEARENGNFRAIRDGANVADFNRLTSDGNIVAFYKSSTNVGSIGSDSGTIYIDGGSGSTGLYFGSSNIYPRDGGAAVNNAVDIGHGSYKFKDLYLAGNAQIGSEINFTAQAVDSQIKTTTSYLEIIGNTTDTADGARMWIGNGQSDQGWYANAANFFFRNLSGTAVVYINTGTGNLGIGTTTPNAKIHVSSGSNETARFESTDAGSYISIKDSASTSFNFIEGGGDILALGTNNAEKMRIMSGGNIGINTTDPQQKLHVEGEVRADRFRVDATGAIIKKQNDSWTSGNQIHDVLYNGWRSSTGDYVYLKASGNSTADHGIIQVADLGTFIGQTDLEQGGLADSNTDPIDTVFAFFRNDKSYVKGLLGVGTNNPGYKLEVTSSDGDALARFKDSDSSYDGIRIGGDTNGGYIGNATGFTKEAIYLQNSINAIRVYTNGSERMRITSAGKVGIGTSSPSYLLHIDNVGGGDGIALQDTNDAGSTGLHFLNNSGTIVAEVSGLSDNTGMTFETAGTEAMRITDGGDVLINRTATLSDNKLAIQTDSGEGAIGIQCNQQDGSTKLFDVYNLGGNNIYQQVIQNDSTPVLIWRMFDGSSTITERMRFTHDGKLGIGTSSPSEKLEVNGSIGIGRSAGGYTFRETVGGAIRAGIHSTSSNDLLFKYGSNAEGMRLNSSGNVGIGTTSPAYRLHVSGGSGFAVDSGSGSHDFILASRENFYDSSSHAAIWITSGSGTGGFKDGEGAHLIFEGRKQTRNFYFKVGDVTAPQHIMHNNGKVGIGTGDVTPNATLQVSGDISVGDGHFIGDDSFDNLALVSSTAENIVVGANNHIYFTTGATSLTSTGTTRLIVMNDGKVGIGTTAPTEKLHVEGNIELINNGYIGSLDGSYWQRIRFEDDTPASTNAFNFETRNGSGSFINHMTITNNGDVGIGTSTANAKLHVSDATAPTFRLSRTGTGQIWQQSIDSNGRFILQEAASEGGTKYTRLAIDDDGAMGVGRGDPTYRLDVKGTGSTLARFLADSNTDDALVRIIGGNYATEKDAILFLGEGDTYGMTVEYDGVANIGYLGMNNNVDPTGAYSKRIQMSRGGTEVAFMAGNVGIGTASPGSKLTVEGDIKQTTGDLLYSGGGNWDIKHTVNDQNIVFSTSQSGSTTEKVRIRYDGRVGIGTSSPGYPLDVLSTGNDSVIRARTPTANAGAYFHAVSGTNGFYGLSLFHQGTEKFFIGGYGAERLGFWVGAKTTASNEKMSLDTSGRLGIGTTSPDNQLMVQGPSSTGSGSTGNVALFEGPSGTNGLKVFVDDTENAAGLQTIATDDLLLNPFGGLVGIGTTSPDGNLEVIASTTVSGASDSVNNVLIGLQAANRPTIILDTADTTYTNRTWNITNVGSAGSLFFGRNGLDVLVMKNDGKVGIGTTSPANLLSIESTGQFAGMNIKSASSNGISYIDFGDADDNNIGGINYDNSTDTLQLRNGNTNHVFLKTDGKVGIGTGSPAAELEVSNATNPEIRVVDTTNSVIAGVGATDSNATIGSISAHDSLLNYNNSAVLRLSSTKQVYHNTTRTADRLLYGGNVETYQYLDTRDYMRPKGHHAASEHIIFETGKDIRVVPYLDDTNIYLNGVLKHSNTTAFEEVVISSADTSLYDRVSADKPIIVTTGQPRQAGSPISFGGHMLAAFTTRYYPIRFRLFSPYSKVDVEVYRSSTSTVDISGTPSYTGTINQNGGLEITESGASGTNYWIIKATGYIIGALFPTGGDQIIMPPIGQEVLSNAQATSVLKINDGTNTSETASTSNNGAYYYRENRGDRELGIGAFGTADGAGGDAEYGVPLEFLSDYYIYPEDDITNFRLASYTANKIQVLDKSGNRLYAFDHSAATKAVPAFNEEGAASGGDNALNSNGPFRFIGTAPFHLVCQSTSDYECVQLGAMKEEIGKVQSFTGGHIPNLLKVGGDITLEGNGSGNSSRILYFTNSACAIQRDANNLKLHAYDNMIFGVSNTAYPTFTERMRIDTSGNLLVGTTSAANSSAGFRAYNGGNGAFTIAGTTLTLNRLSNDGEILQLQKDTTMVGSIGTFSQDSQSNFYIGFNNASEDVGLGFGHASGTGRAYYPCRDGGSGVSAAIDLGTSTYKYKDLHLSGTVNAFQFKWNIDGAGNNYLGTDANDGLVLHSRAGESIKYGAGETVATTKAHIFYSSTTNNTTGLGTEIFSLTAGGQINAVGGNLTIKEVTGTPAYTQIKKTNTGSNLAIVSQESIYMMLDANNDQTNRSFQIVKDSDVPGSGSSIFTVLESGATTVSGALEANGLTISTGGNINFAAVSGDVIKWDGTYLNIGAAEADDHTTRLRGFGGTTEIILDDGQINVEGNTRITKNKTATSTPILEIKDDSSTDVGGEYISLLYDGSTTNQVGGVIGMQQPVTNAPELFIANGDSTSSVGLAFWGYIGTAQIVPCGGTGVDRDNSIDLGSSSSRFDDIYATNGTIQTSDRNDKTDFEHLSTAERRVALRCKDLIKRFRWNSAKEEKGDAARYHFGIIAQDVQDAFIQEGLDAGDYGIFISKTWWEATVDGEVRTYETEELAPQGAVEKTRLGIRYNELLALIIAVI